MSDETMGICRRYNIVSPGTSLLVLESLDQYIEYDVEPPKQLPAMRQEFLLERRLLNVRKKDEKREHLEGVVNLWNTRVQWWKTDFDAVLKKRGKAIRERHNGDANDSIEPDIEYSPQSNREPALRSSSEPMS